MDRNLISWNIPNLITVPLMAMIAFLAVGLIWQVAMKGFGGGNNSASVSTSGGY